MTPRRRVLLALAITIPLSFALKTYDGPGRWWANNWGASFGYEIFFMLLASLAFPRARALPVIAVSVCAGTCALEFLQMWKAPWLEAARATFLGRSLLGNSFSWADLPAYPLGTLAGWWLLRTLTQGPP